MTKPPCVTKQKVKEVMEEVGELDLPDSAHWTLIHERLGLEYGDVFSFIADDLEFFGVRPYSTKGNEK